MKARLITTLTFGILTAGLVLFSAFNALSEDRNQHSQRSSVSDEILKKQALKILDTKCNVCHRKQNPFMVFKAKNISKRAKKIYRMVFLDKKMPKGDDIKLTIDEYNKLEKWLFTQKIF